MTALTYDELKALSPCSDSLKRITKLMGGARKWGGRKITAAMAREAGATFSDIMWAASAVAAAWAAARAAEEAWQFDRLVARLSDPEPADWPLPDRQSVAA